MVLVASYLLDTELLEKDIVTTLGRGNIKTGKRMFSEFKKRLAHVPETVLNYFVNSDYSTQKQVAFYILCKTHALIRDFVVEVIREKHLVYDYTLTDGDYISFYRRKVQLHSELEAISELSKAKVKQVIFKMLEEATFIDSVKLKNIQPQIVDVTLQQLIKEDHKDWLKVFLMSDLDINNNN
jgi:hypothetical protein